MWIRIILCTAIIQTSLAYSPWIYNGTTPNLENIIKGRCTEYQVLNLNNRDSEFQVKVDCNALWDNFTSAFKNQDQCKTNFTNAYEKTFALTENKKMYTNNVTTLSHIIFLSIFSYFIILMLFNSLSPFSFLCELDIVLVRHKRNCP